jgi:hypothetical protein
MKTLPQDTSQTNMRRRLEAMIRLDPSCTTMKDLLQEARIVPAVLLQGTESKVLLS